MIRKIPKPGFIERYRAQLFCEADTSNRKNIKRITLSDTGGAAINGSSRAADDIETDMEDDDLPEMMPDDSGSTDVELEPDDPGGGEDTPPASDGGGDVELEPEEDDMPDDAQGSDETEAGGGTDVVTEPDDESVSDGADGDEGSGESSGEENTEDFDENLKKRALFSKYSTLHDSIEAYIDKLNMMLAHGNDVVREYRDACDKFEKLRTYLYDYMLIRFSKASYTESFLFYQRALTTVMLILDELKESDDFAENKKNDTKHIAKQGAKSKKSR